MNSKKTIHFLSLLFALVFIGFGCGVKGDPVPPASSLLPSVEKSYLEPLKPKDKMKKEKKEKSEKENPAD